MPIYDDSLPKEVISGKRKFTQVEWALIATRLVELEAEFLVLAHVAYDDDLLPELEHHNSKVIQLVNSIRTHRYALSPLQKYPLELFERIFKACVECDEETRFTTLATLTLVCRSWRAVVIHLPVLWAVLPPMPLRSVLRSLASRSDTCIGEVGPASRHRNLCKQFLERSGAVPLTVQVSLPTHTAWNWDFALVETMIHDVASILGAIRSRWESVRIELPSSDYYHYFRSWDTGDLPILKTLNFIVTYHSGTSEDSPWDTEILWFSSARDLRSANLAIANREFVLPLHAPLEDVTVAWDRVKNAWDIYKSLIQVQSPTLRRFCFTLKSDFNVVVTPLPTMTDVEFESSIPYSLPSMAELDFSALEGISSSFVTHLNMVTLPSLKILRLPSRSSDSRGPPDDQVYVALARLVRRSCCALEKLTGHKPLPTLPSHAEISEATFEILACSPGLTTVTLGDTGGEGFWRLMFDSESPEPMLPNLEKLVIDDLDAALGEDLAHPKSLRDVDRLMDMVASRRTPLGPPFEGHLEEVHLKGYDVAALQYSLVKWETDVLGHLFVARGAPVPATADLEIIRTVERATAALHPIRLPPDMVDGSDGWGRDRFSRIAYREALDAVEELEAVNFLEVSSLVVARGTLLFRMSDMRKYGVQDYDAGTAEVDINHLEDRLSALLEKWKPYILRDARVLPYTWSFVGTNAYLRWQRDASGKFDDSDKELWKRLTSAPTVV